MAYTGTPAQKTGLDIASQRLAKGTASAADKKNLDYAKKTLGYAYVSAAKPAGALPSGGAGSAIAAAPAGAAVVAAAPTPAAAPAPAPAAAPAPAGAPVAAAAAAPAAVATPLPAAPAPRHVGPSEWDTIRKKYGLTPANESQYVVRNPPGMPTGIYIKPEFDPKLSRSSLEATGYKYLGTIAGRDAAIKAGEDVKLFNGSYYIIPKKTTGTSDPIRKDIAAPTETTISNPSTDLINKPVNIPGIGNVTEADVPEAPHLVTTYKDLRASENIDALEADVNSINDQLRQLDTSFNSGKNMIENQMGPMTLLRGEQGQLQEQYQATRDGLVNQLAAKADMLKTKNDSIQTLMGLTQGDYDNTRTAYNDKFSRAMDTQRLYNEGRSIDLSAKTLQNSIDNQKRDDARANISVLTDGMTASNRSWADMISANPAFASQMSSLESTAGLPAGSIKTFTEQRPGAKINAIVNGTDKDGNDITSFVYQDAQGNPKVSEVKAKTGGYTAPSSATEANAMKAANLKQEDSPDGGFNFFDGAHHPITGGQYAAIKGINVNNLLQTSKNPNDKIIMQEINQAVSKAWEKNAPVNQLRTLLYQNYPRLFEGTSDDDITTITGYRQVTKG